LSHATTPAAGERASGRADGSAFACIIVRHFTDDGTGSGTPRRTSYARAIGRGRLRLSRLRWSRDWRR
jgi:hypothetical protein